MALSRFFVCQHPQFPWGTPCSLSSHGASSRSGSRLRMGTGYFRLLFPWPPFHHIILSLPIFLSLLYIYINNKREREGVDVNGVRRRRGTQRRRPSGCVSGVDTPPLCSIYQRKLAERNTIGPMGTGGKKPLFPSSSGSQSGSKPHGNSGNRGYPMGTGVHSAKPRDTFVNVAADFTSVVETRKQLRDDGRKVATGRLVRGHNGFYVRRRLSTICAWARRM
jgi:hypothetical protein